MSDSRAGGLRWRAVALGWLAAVLAGFAISPLLRSVYGLMTEPPIPRDEFTLAMVTVSLLSGFLAYLFGGYVAATRARVSTGTNGAMTAVFGLVAGAFLGGVLAVFGEIFPEGVALPPAVFGLNGRTLLAGAILFLVNLFGAFVGGKLGEPSPKSTRPG